MTTKILETPSDSQDLIRRASFRFLLARSEPVEAKELAAATGIKIEWLSPLLDTLDAAGRIRRDGGGRVVGSAGLSVIPDRHEIELDGRKFWTCAPTTSLASLEPWVPAAAHSHQAPVQGRLGSTSSTAVR